MVGAIVGGLLLLTILAGICTAIVSDSESTNDGEQEQVSEADPVATPISITAQRLYEERETNATRYDDTYKGKIVRVSGTVDRIDGGKVYLQIPGSLFGDVALNGIPREDQAPLNPNNQVVAVCTVGEYIIGTISLEKCQIQ